MSVLLLDGDATARLRDIPDGTVHACVTSPPYLGHRDYGVAGQIGAEGTPDAFVAGLVSVFREVKRVLRDDGSCWIVIGDSYADKSLIGIPWTLALALRADGWYLRSSICWAKGSCMPESVKDRPTNSHENIFLLTKTDRYFYDGFAVSEPFQTDPKENYERRAKATGRSTQGFAEARGGDRDKSGGFPAPNGRRNLRNVWTINPEPLLQMKHFAAFPSRLASRCIQAATSEAGCCPVCRSPLLRVVEKGEPDRQHMAACGADSAGGYGGESQKDYDTAGAQNASDTKRRILEGMRVKRTIGWKPSCTCANPGPAVPALVIDPFSGAGTTIMCATRLGRDAIGIDLNSDYNDMAADRIGNFHAKCLDTNGVRLPFVETSVYRCPFIFSLREAA